jgi:hypothetical protein
MVRYLDDELPTDVGGEADRPHHLEIVNLADTGTGLRCDHCLAQQLRSHHRREERTTIEAMVDQKPIDHRIELKRDT